MAGLSGWYNPALNVYSYVMATWAEWQLVNVFSVTASRWNLETLWKRVRAQVHRGYESIFDATKILAEHVAAERYFLYFSVWWSYSLKHQTKQQPPHPPKKITKYKWRNHLTNKWSTSASVDDVAAFLTQKFWDRLNLFFCFLLAKSSIDETAPVCTCF